MTYWWMSFVDPNRPTGDRFLGALIVEADDHYEMMAKSHRLKLNPGGEVQFFAIPEQFEYRVPLELVNRKLLTRTECEELEARWEKPQ